MRKNNTQVFHKEKDIENLRKKYATEITHKSVA